MTHSVRLDIPDEIYRILVQQSAAAGRRVEDVVMEWLAQHIPASGEALDAEERRQEIARFERWFGAVQSGDPDSGNNERIDAAIATS